MTFSFFYRTFFTNSSPSANSNISFILMKKCLEHELSPTFVDQEVGRDKQTAHFSLSFSEILISK